MTHCPPWTVPCQRWVARLAARRSVADHEQRGEPSEHRRDRERDQRAEDADRMQSVHPAPVDGVDAPLDDGGPDQPADQGVTRARGQPEPPGRQVPGGGRRQARADHRDRLRRRHGHDSSDRVRDGGAHQQRAQQVEDRREDDRLRRPRGAGGHQRRDRVRGVVQPVGDREAEREEDRDRESCVHPPTLCGPVAIALTKRRSRLGAAMNEERSDTGTRVVIVGGGVAGLETLLALELTSPATGVALTLVAPQPDFVYKPLLVEEPFDLGPAERHELGPLAEEKGARFVQRAVTAVRPEATYSSSTTARRSSTTTCSSRRAAVSSRRWRERRPFPPAPSRSVPTRSSIGRGQGPPPGVRRPGGGHLVAAALRARPDDATPCDRAATGRDRSRSSPPNPPPLRSSARRQARPSASYSRQGGSTSSRAQRCAASTKAESP